MSEIKAKALVEDGHNSHGGVSNPRPPDVGAEQASSTSQSKFINSAVNYSSRGRGDHQPKGSGKHPPKLNETTRLNYNKYMSESNKQLTITMSIYYLHAIIFASISFCIIT